MQKIVFRNQTYDVHQGKELSNVYRNQTYDVHQGKELSNVYRNQTYDVHQGKELSKVYILRRVFLVVSEVCGGPRKPKHIQRQREYVVIKESSVHGEHSIHHDYVPTVEHHQEYLRRNVVTCW